MAFSNFVSMLKTIGALVINVNIKKYLKRATRSFSLVIYFLTKHALPR